METTAFFLVVAGLAALAIYSSSQRKKRLREATVRIGATESFGVGRYVTGLAQGTAGTGAVCGVTAVDLVFLNPRALELGRIPRDSVNAVLVDRTTQITQRLTATRMLTLGVFSLAAPKKKKNEEFSILIDWDDANGIRQNTVFQSTSQSAGNSIANRIRGVLRPKAQRLAPDERKCPYCSETIKADAAVCRFCRNPLAPTELPSTGQSGLHRSLPEPPPVTSQDERQLPAGTGAAAVSRADDPGQSGIHELSQGQVGGTLRADAGGVRGADVAEDDPRDIPWWTDEPDASPANDVLPDGGIAGTTGGTEGTDSPWWSEDPE